MSHDVTRTTHVTRTEPLKRAATRVQAKSINITAAPLNEATAAQVHLRDWLHPVRFNLKTGKATFDNWEGRWGDEARLHELLSAYAEEALTIEVEQRVENGVVESFEWTDVVENGEPMRKLVVNYPENKVEAVL